MVQIIHKFGDATVGDVVSLKSGGPQATIIGFEGAEPVTPVSAPGAPLLAGVGYVEAEPVARVAWITADGVAHIHRYPLAALNLKAQAKDKPAPGPGPHNDPTAG
jgi:Uncharacterized small protein (DUF2158)